MSQCSDAEDSLKLSQYGGECSPPCEDNTIGYFRWNTPEYLDNYAGQVLKSCPHGAGEYRWAGRGDARATYEGSFYAGRLEGAGVLSTADGTVFGGLFHRNYRYGPGVETTPGPRCSAGLWRGGGLVRLAWRPAGLVPALAPPDKMAAVAPYRVKLRSKTIRVSDMACAETVMRQVGAREDLVTSAHGQLYSDTAHSASAFFDKRLFDETGYGGEYSVLQVVKPEFVNVQELSDANVKLYNSWNNSRDMVDMMRHCYKHWSERADVAVSLADVTGGRRDGLPPPAPRELACRAVLLASYLGDVGAVSALVSDDSICPDISDCEGNSALMYACCADAHDVMSFLLAAGAQVDRQNDCCLTPLAMALLRYVAAVKDVPKDQFHVAFLPQHVDVGESENLFEDWQIHRDSRWQGKISPDSSRTKSQMQHDKVGDEASTTDVYQVDLFYRLQRNIEINEMGARSVGNRRVEYVFTSGSTERLVTPPTPEKKGKGSKVKGTKSSTKSQATTNASDSMSTLLNDKAISLEKIEATILHLLDAGADPAAGRCPAPALAVALYGDNPNIVTKLVQSGADVNETFQQISSLRAIDIALSRPYSASALLLTQSLLAAGATVRHRLPPSAEELEWAGEDDEGGRPLLHYVVEKRAGDEAELEIQKGILDLLLQHGACPAARHLGRSVLDAALQLDVGLAEHLAAHPAVDLNEHLNDERQTALVKIFDINYFSMLEQEDFIRLMTCLVENGADCLVETAPVVTPHSVETTNVFTYAQEFLNNLASPTTPVKKDARSAKASSRGSAKERAASYRACVARLRRAGRARQARAVRAALLRALLEVVHRFNHRPWQTIIREHQSPKQTALWLTPDNMLETWHIVRLCGRPYGDRKEMFKATCIMLLYYRDPFLGKLPMTMCDEIEKDARTMMRNYSGPELTQKYMDNIRWCRAGYAVCFECCQPLGARRLECDRCALVAFCGGRCRARNSRRACHPCAVYLHDDGEGAE